MPLKSIVLPQVGSEARDAASPMWSPVILTPCCPMDHPSGSKGREDLTFSYLLPTELGFTALLSGTALGTEQSKEGPKAPGWRLHVVPGSDIVSGSMSVIF